MSSTSRRPKASRSALPAVLFSVLLAAILVAALPAASAKGEGTVLGPLDAEVVATLVEPALGPIVCYRDSDGDGAYDSGDAVYLVMQSVCATVPATALRVTSSGAGTAGTQVEAGHDDHGDPVTGEGLDEEFRYVDNNDDGRPNGDDSFYLVLCGPACDQKSMVSEGWARLTASGALAPGGVEAGDADVGRPVTTANLRRDLATDLRYWDLDGDGRYGLGDVMYWTVTGFASNVLVNHVRLGALGDLPFGSVAAVGDPDVVPITSGLQAGPVFCYGDADGDGRYGPGEPVYLVAAGHCGTLQGAAFRMNRVGSGSPGSAVLPGEEGHGQPITALGSGFAFRYVDVSGDGHPGAGDTFYLGVCGGGSCSVGNSVAEGWIRLSSGAGKAAGSVVAGGDGDAGEAASTAGLSTRLSTDIRYWDLDSDSMVDGDDVLYWSTTGWTGYPQVHHLRLGDLHGTAGFGSVMTGDDPDTVAVTLPFSSNARVCVLDTDASGRYDAGEPVFLVGTGTCASIPATAFRLSGTDGFGTLVDDGDERGEVAIEEGFEYAFRFDDRSGDGRPGRGDVFYLALCGGESCGPGQSVAPGWVRLAGGDAGAPGSVVAAGDADAGRAAGAQGLQARLGLDFRYWDLDGDTTFSSGDPLYWATRGYTSAPEVHHVRLTGAWAVEPGPEASPTKNGDGGTASPGTNDGGGDGDGDGEGGGGEKGDSPAPPLALLLGALGALAWVARRR